MIRSFRNRALTELWHDDDARGIRTDLVKRLKTRLSRLDTSTRPQDMNLPGFNFHKLQGDPVRYTVHINGPWCLTFEWDGEDAVRVDLEQYH
jgi:proteic killer suppression protein